MKKYFIKTKEDFIKESKKIHGERFDYSQVNFINMTTPVKIYCTNCKIWFSQAPSNHLKSKYGCPECKNKLTIRKHKWTTEDFIKEANKVIPPGRYDYSKVNFIDSTTEVTIIDLETSEEFQVQPCRFLHRQYRDPNKKTGSYGEELVKTCLEKLEEEYNISWKYHLKLKGLIHGRNTDLVEIDFSVITPDKKKIYWIEYNGGYHYKLNTHIPLEIRGQSFIKQLERDLNVRKYCEDKNNLDLIELPTTVYNNFKIIYETLKKIIIDKNPIETVLKKELVKFIDPNTKLIDVDVKEINNFISIINNSIDDNTWKENLKLIYNTIGHKSISKDDIVRIILKEFKVGSLIRLTEIKERLRNIYQSINYRKTPKSSNLKEFFIIKRRSIFVEDIPGERKQAPYFYIVDIKPEYKHLIQPT